MNRNILKRYDALKDEQSDVARRVERISRELSNLSHTVVSDTVEGTREDGTFGPIKISGIPMPEYEEKKENLRKNLAHYESIQNQLNEMISEIEAFISEIPEPRIRTILRLKYIDGKTWRDIGFRYQKGPSWAFKKIENYFSENA